MSPDLLDLLAQGENAAVEFKEYGVRAESLAREFAGFANHQGGTLLLGVSDAGEIIGIPEQTQNLEEWVINIARNNVVPPLEIEFHWQQLDNKLLARIEISKGRDKPYQVAGKYYLRIGSTNRLASQGELLRLFQAAGFFHVDTNPVEGTSLQDLNFTALEHYFSEYRIAFASEPEANKRRLLINSDVLDESAQVTIAGLLIFGIDPERHLPQAGISFAHFAGTEIQSELIDKQNIGGGLPFQVDNALAVIKNNLRVPSIIEGTQRRSQRLYPPDKVFRELIVNACVHRNYAIHGSKIRIFIFNDRIEFISPGKLPNTVTIEKLKVGVSYAVNPVLVKFMENMGYVDRLGRGLPMVVQEMRRLDRIVGFKEIGEEFKVTLSLE